MPFGKIQIMVEKSTTIFIKIIKKIKSYGNRQKVQSEGSFSSLGHLVMYYYQYFTGEKIEATECARYYIAEWAFSLHFKMIFLMAGLC